MPLVGTPESLVRKSSSRLLDCILPAAATSMDYWTRSKRIVRFADGRVPALNPLVAQFNPLSGSAKIREQGAPGHCEVLFSPGLIQIASVGHVR